MPRLKQMLAEAGLPKDLVYLAMIESGLSVHATSHAQAVGPWQFIKPTATRFGLTVNWWLDERRDFYKSTKAAIQYLKYLHERFDCWYLAAAAYNTGEGRVSRMIKKHKTRDFWQLANSKSLAKETQQYIPKLLATMLMAKTPRLYGFHDIPSAKDLPSETFYVPGGTHLDEVAKHLKITKKSLYDMNAALVKKYVPSGVSGYRIRIPKGASKQLGQYIASKFAEKSTINH